MCEFVRIDMLMLSMVNINKAKRIIRLFSAIIMGRIGNQMRSEARGTGKKIKICFKMNHTHIELHVAAEWKDISIGDSRRVQDRKRKQIDTSNTAVRCWERDVGTGRSARRPVCSEVTRRTDANGPIFSHFFFCFVYCGSVPPFFTPKTFCRTNAPS